MIPLRDDQPTSTFPILTILIIALNVYVYIQQQIDPSITVLYSLIPYSLTHGRDIGYHDWLRENPAFLSGMYAVPSPPRPLWTTLFTCMFLHANLLHIGGNMLFFWVFGNNIEDALGKLRFLFFYFACGLAASLSMVISAPNSAVITLGASGAIAGVLGAYFLLFPQAKVLSIIPICFLGFFAEIRAFWVLGFWIVLNILQSVEGVDSGVAYLEHIVGFGVGMVLIVLFGGRNLTRGTRRRSNS